MLNEPPVFSQEIAQSILINLDDRTIDQRGDIGSVLRSEAMKAAVAAMRDTSLDPENEMAREMVARICGLAAEKLDRVRFEAAKCLQDNRIIFGLEHLELPYSPLHDILFPPRPNSEHRNITGPESVSTITYFTSLLSHTSSDSSLCFPLLRGLITTTGSSSDALMQTSRIALLSHTAALSNPILETFCNVLAVDLLRASLTDERLCIPTLETINFLLETTVLHRLIGTEFRFVGFCSFCHLVSVADGTNEWVVS